MSFVFSIEEGIDAFEKIYHSAMSEFKISPAADDLLICRNEEGKLRWRYVHHEGDRILCTIYRNGSLNWNREKSQA